MKKMLSLLMTVILLVTVVGAIPTVLADEQTYPPISDEIKKKYWGTYTSKSVTKVEDWYYFVQGNVYTGERHIDSVCGYDGDEVEITIPTKLNGEKINSIDKFYLISDTVETIKIPKEIKVITRGYDENADYHIDESQTYFRVSENSKLKEIIVDSENEKFTAENGVLFSKGYTYLYFYPPQKTDVEYNVELVVKTICSGAFRYAINLKSLTIPQSIWQIEYGAIGHLLEKLYFDNTNDIVRFSKSGLGERGRYEAPKVPNGTIYCTYGTPMHKYYEENKSTKTYNGEPFFKELKVIPRKDGESLIKEDGVWYYYDNGEKTNRSTLIKHSGKWFYVKNGVWDKTVNDKIIDYKNKWFYIKNGKWSSSVNTLVKIDREWLGIESGKWDTSTKTLIKYKGKWFYIRNGKWDTSAKTLIKYKGKWFYIKNGKWCKDTAIVKYKGKRFYVKKGKIDFSYSGKKKIDGKTYKIKNGKVV